MQEVLGSHGVLSPKRVDRKTGQTLLRQPNQCSREDWSAKNSMEKRSRSAELLHPPLNSSVEDASDAGFGLYGGLGGSYAPIVLLLIVFTTGISSD